jgi:hypothetical protein
MNVVSVVKRPEYPLAGGFYTVREAARLLGIGHSSAITKWAGDRRDAGLGPAVARWYQGTRARGNPGRFSFVESDG